MPAPRLDSVHVALIVIDVQPRIMSAVHAHETITTNIAAMIEGCRCLDIPTALTEHCVDRFGESVPEIAAQAAQGATRFAKTRFSAATAELVGWLRSTDKRQVILCGVEAHVCVLQTAIDLANEGIRPFLLIDAISATLPSQIAPAIRRMESAGAVSSSVIGALYELMQDANHPAFRSVLVAAKRVRDFSDQTENVVR
ncbi:MAG: isochorismatase family protein [Planctomycetota bacterium]|nr:isochorismatase family protein [Planctomycetota bacterium]